MVQPFGRKAHGSLLEARLGAVVRRGSLGCAFRAVIGAVRFSCCWVVTLAVTWGVADVEAVKPVNVIRATTKTTTNDATVSRDFFEYMIYVSL